MSGWGERGRGFAAGLFHELVQTLAQLLFAYERPPAPPTGDERGRDGAGPDAGGEQAPPPKPRADRPADAPAGVAPAPPDAGWAETEDGGRVPVWGAPPPGDAADGQGPGRAPEPRPGRPLPPPVGLPPGHSKPEKLPDLPSPPLWEPGTAVPDGLEAEAPLPDWRQALLEEAGLRPVGGEPGAQPGSPGGPGATEYQGKSPHNWMIDGGYRGGYGMASLRGPTDETPLKEGERLLFAGPQGLPPFEDGPRRRWVPMRHPKEQREALMRWVHQLYDAPTQHLLERLTDEPLFAYGRRQWRHAPASEARANNQQIVDAVYLRLSRLMGAIYGFEPAVLAYTPRMPGDFFEWYDWEQNRLYILEQVLAGTYADLMEALAHGQAHAMQRQLIVAAGAGRLEGDLAAFGELIVREHQAQPGPGCIGWVKGYHAFQISYAVGYRARSLA